MITIATRKSKLALWQAEHVAALLRAQNPEETVELLPLSTRGDDITDRPLARIGGKGLFIKTLEQALLDGRADLAVHSLKDVPAELSAEFTLTATIERDDPHDALVATQYANLDDLPHGARIGSASLRRQAQLRHYRPDVEVTSLRGNVGTRLSKLDAGDFDAIVLAAVGLKRLGLSERIRERLAPEICLPAVGQGTLGIECLAGNDRIIALLAGLNDADTWTRTQAERALNARLEGSCQVPLAAFAELDGDTLNLRARVATPDGSRLLKAQRSRNRAEAHALGVACAEDLLAQGAGDILASLS